MLVVFQLHENFIATYFDFVRQRSLSSRHAHRISCPKIELRTMPWADQAVAVQLAVSKRPAIVRANVLDAKHLTIQQCQDHKSVIDLTW